MDHFLDRLIARTLGAAPGIEPLIPSIYANRSDLSDGLPDLSRDEWGAPSHEGLLNPQRPLPVGGPSREEDYATLGNKKNDRIEEAAHPSMEKPNLPSDSTQVRGDPFQLVVKAVPFNENIVYRKPHYQISRAKRVPLPSPDSKTEESAYIPSPMEYDSGKHLTPDYDGESHRSGRSLVNALQTTAGGTDAVSRTNVEREQRESQQLRQDAPVLSASEDLLVPIPSTDHNTAAFTESRATVFESPPNQVLGPRSSPPPTKVTIGRIEVRAVMRPEPRPPAAESGPKKNGPALSLENYLRQRDRNRL